MIDLRLGDWRDVLAGVECDALIVDPPYGARTHAGHNAAVNQGMVRMRAGMVRMRALSYEHWTAIDVRNGAYVVNRDPGHIGGKPLQLMHAIVRDYTRPGDLVCDPCAGHGTTLRAAAAHGRRAIGAEVDPETHAAALTHGAVQSEMAL